MEVILTIETLRKKWNRFRHCIFVKIDLASIRPQIIKYDFFFCIEFFTSQRLFIPSFMEIGWQELGFFRRIKSLCFWLLGDSTMEVYYRAVNFTATLLKKCFKAYFSPISTIICRKTRIKVNFKFHFCLLLGDAQCRKGLLPHFWKVRLKTSRANFDQFFHGYFEEEKSATLSIGI